MRKIKKRKKGGYRRIVFIIAVIIILASIVLAWWVFFGKKKSFTGDNVIMEIVAPTETVAGELVTYEVKYVNNEEVDLRNVEISLIYPNGFSFESSNPKSASFNDNKWELSTIEKGESGSIEIKGNLFGEVGSTVVASASINYKPENVSSSFTQRAEAKTKISALDLDMEISIPDTVQKDTEFEYTISLLNNKRDDVKNVRLEIDFPDNFEFISSDPSRNNGSIWDIPLLMSSESKEIKIRGKITGEVGDLRTLKTRYGLYDEYGNFYLQYESLDQVKLVEIAGELRLLVNGNEKSNANPGDTLEYSLLYKNTGTESLEEGTIELIIDGFGNLDDVDIQVDKGSYENGKAKWTYEEISNLGELKKDQEGVLVFRINIKNPIIVDDIEDKNIIIKTKPIFKAKRAGSDEEVIIEGNQVETRINTEAVIGREARYYNYESKKIGSGPIPPKAGEKTTYRIYLTLGNRTNDIENARFEFNLGEIAIWAKDSNVEVGDIKLEGDLLVWDIGKVPANTGQFTDSMEASFDISIVPRDQDVGNPVNLIDGIIFRGSDSYTGNTINNDLGSLSTELEKDFMAQGKGVVVK